MTALKAVMPAVMHRSWRAYRLSGLSVFLLSQRRIFVIFARQRFVFFAFILL
jgi:hypothetical protein